MTRLTALLLAVVSLTGCAPTMPLATAAFVDLDRFMGDWYVQGHVPAGSEKHAYNGVESYARGDGSRILTSYVFRDGGFDSRIRTMEPVGFVVDDGTNAEWGMRFLWPFKAEYLVAHLDEAYTETIIARSKRDYAWIMTRDREISDERYAELLARLVELGYREEDVRRVPQRWPDPEHPAEEAGGQLALFTRAR